MSPFSEDVLEECGRFFQTVLSNGFGVIHIPQEHFREVGHEGGKGRGKRGIETVVEEQQVHPAIVQHHRALQVEEVGEETTGGVVTRPKLRRHAVQE